MQSNPSPTGHGKTTILAVLALLSLGYAAHLNINLSLLQVPLAKLRSPMAQPAVGTPTPPPPPRTPPRVPPFLLTRTQIRDGPGTEHRVVRVWPPGMPLTIVERLETNKGAWLRLEDGAWVASNLVSGHSSHLLPTIHHPDGWQLRVVDLPDRHRALGRGRPTYAALRGHYWLVVPIEISNTGSMTLAMKLPGLYLLPPPTAIARYCRPATM